jgi:DNA repair protein RadC
MAPTLPDSGSALRIAGFAAARSLFAPLAAEPVEVAAFAYLDPEWRLLGMRHARSALATAIDVPMRAVATDVLVFDCARVVMAHNHPSGDAAPSAMDRALTKRLARALDALGVQLFDHLVLSGERVTSFRALGLL